MKKLIILLYLGLAILSVSIYFIYEAQIHATGPFLVEKKQIKIDGLVCGFS